MTVTVIFILGYGRSGSTVLDTVLGQHGDVIGVGELVNLHRQGWLANHYCSCGERGNDCPFWSQVKALWRESTGIDDPAEYVALQDRFGDFMSALVPWGSVWRDRGPAGTVARYLGATAALYDAVAEASGKRVIVDSSKMPAWGFVLANLPGIDLKVVHLVRDGRATAWSLGKSYPEAERSGVQMDIPGRPAWQTSLRWVAVNLESEFLVRNLRLDALRLRYEDLVTAPEAALARIGRLAGMDFSEIGAAVAAGTPVAPFHNIAGNRLRMAGPVAVSADPGWREKLSAVDEAAFWATAWPLALLYGYRPGRRGPATGRARAARGR